MYASKGSFEVKLLTRGTDGKAEMGGVREEQRRSKKIRHFSCLLARLTLLAAGTRN